MTAAKSPELRANDPKPAEPRPTSANRILETALELFVTRGYEGTSVREICEAACITKPTLYYFYGSKEGVFRALVNGAMEEMRHDVVSALAEPRPLIDQLRTITRNLFEDASRRRKLWQFVAQSKNMMAQNADACAEAMGSHTDFMKLLGDAVDAAVARGEFTPGPTHIRLMVLAGAIGKAIDHFLFFAQPVLTSDIADQLIDVIVTGWLAPAPAAQTSSIQDPHPHPPAPSPSPDDQSGRGQGGAAPLPLLRSS